MHLYSKEDILKLGISNPMIEAHIKAYRTTPGITWEAMLQSLVIELHKQLSISHAQNADLSMNNGRLNEEVDRLLRDCSEAYQVIGAGMFMEPCKYTQEDVERALDNLIAAVNGDERPHDDLLPWPKGAN